MPAEETKQLCILTREKLRDAKQELEQFLNNHCVTQLTEGQTDQPAETEAYICDFLADLRHLSVACELGYEKVSLVLRRAKFNHDFAEKVLSEIVHSCIYCFYYPRNEVYEEDGRYSYTSVDAIKFRQTPPEPLRQITVSLSKIFEILRDELEYYETDYVTRIRMQKT
ncbi:DUF3907 family protein [Paenactinomyces guangxiensis]|uniref:DUF3907 family protein n=1 Tax=Paenactinomyces guangxiensis TaxID=1490290 RepID=A0A7W1WMZ3_9BACL|nr:DUF3907 family protein [Paenactinomyces guangxiensis]MBA4492810.1 DUF3907 family protein [Paenactinomyces guangxiensis]MBH8590341.1 DUF3907 family protein [Paenactinomyces guangxiensis]